MAGTCYTDLTPWHIKNPCTLLEYKPAVYMIQLGGTYP